MIANPVFRKELLLRFRMRQMSPAMRATALSLAAFLVLFIYYTILDKWIFNDTSYRSGQDAFDYIVGAEAVLICLLAPALAANSITQEKEQQTWEMLISTRLTPTEIILGKLSARCAVPVVTMLLSAPIELVCFFRATPHISLAKAVLTHLVLIAYTVMFTTFGMFMSFFVHRTAFAIMASYAFVVGGLTISTTLLTGMLESLLSSDVWTHSPLMWVNPALMMWEAYNPSDSAYTGWYLALGIAAYFGLTVLMVIRMVTGFRRFAEQR